MTKKFRIRCLLNLKTGVGYEWTEDLARRRGFAEYHGDPNSPPKTTNLATPGGALVDLQPTTDRPEEGAPPVKIAQEPSPAMEVEARTDEPDADAEAAAAAQSAEDASAVEAAIEALTEKDDIAAFAKQLGIQVDKRNSADRMKATLLAKVREE